MKGFGSGKAKDSPGEIRVGRWGSVLKNRSLGVTASIVPKRLLPYRGAKLKKKRYVLSVTSDRQNDILVHRSVYDTPEAAVSYLTKEFDGDWRKESLSIQMARETEPERQELKIFHDAYGNQAVISRKRLYLHKNDRKKQDVYFLSLREICNQGFLYYRNVFPTVYNAEKALWDFSNDTWVCDLD